MPRIYHIIPRSTWQQCPSGPYRADSLASEGFIHCSYAEQVTWVANSFYRESTDLLVLVMDPEKLTSPLRDEDPGIGQLFPHVYGEIDREAVVDVIEMQRSADGAWLFDG